MQPASSICRRFFSTTSFQRAPVIKQLNLGNIQQRLNVSPNLPSKGLGQIRAYSTNSNGKGRNSDLVKFVSAVVLGTVLGNILGYIVCDL